MPRAPIPSGRKLLLLLALAVAVIGGAWWYDRPPHDPEHNGERLSTVVMALEFHSARPDELASYPAKIRAFGPEAMPWLLYTLEHGKHAFDKPEWMVRLLPESWGGVRDSQNMDERTFAAFALGQLGSDAAPAIPLLVKNLGAGSPGLAHYSAVALHAIGPASWPAVQPILETGSRQTRMLLLATIERRIGTDANPAPEEEVAHVLSVLTKACRDPQVNEMAAASLGTCRRARPTCAAFDAAIPVLIELLSDPDLRNREFAANALPNFKGKAAAAVPRLIELLDDAFSAGRRTAAHALGFVDTAEMRSEPVLRSMLYDAEPSCRDAAAAALREMGLSPFEQVR